MPAGRGASGGAAGRRHHPPLSTPAPACTPELAAWLVREGLAVALVDDTAGVARQLLHLPATYPRLVDELYAERFPAAPGGSTRAVRR